MPLGPFQGIVVLKAMLASGANLPELHIPFNGVVVSDIALDPIAIQVGGRKLGQSFEDEVAIRSLIHRPLGEVKAEPVGVGLSVQSIAGSNRFRVRQVVAKTGQQTNRVRFTAESGGRKTTVELSVVYIGFDHK